MSKKLRRDIPEGIGGRFRALREGLGLTQQEFGTELGVSNSTISLIEKEEIPPSFQAIQRLIHKYPHLDIRKLICNEPFQGQLIDAIEVAATVRPVIRAAADSLDDLPQQGIADDYLAVPLVAGTVAAGPGGVVWNQVESLVWVYRPALGRKHRLIAVRVGGDSMEPTVPNGSIVIIDLDQWEPSGGGRHIWALRTENGDTQIKRLHLVKGGLVVVSDNFRVQPPELAWSTDLRQLVIGKVIWMWQSLE